MDDGDELLIAWLRKNEPQKYSYFRYRAKRENDEMNRLICQHLDMLAEKGESILDGQSKQNPEW